MWRETWLLLRLHSNRWLGGVVEAVGSIMRDGWENERCPVDRLEKINVSRFMKVLLLDWKSSKIDHFSSGMLLKPFLMCKSKKLLMSNASWKHASYLDRIQVRTRLQAFNSQLFHMFDLISGSLFQFICHYRLSTLLTSSCVLPEKLSETSFLEMPQS